MYITMYIKLTSPDEMLVCYSSQKISLTLFRVEQTTHQKVKINNEKDDDVTLLEALDVARR